MQAYLMHGPNDLRHGVVPDPSCGPDEILVATEAVSVCSTDVSYYRGHLFPKTWPVVPGHEYVGEVVEVGARLSDVVRVGRRVTYWGQTDFGGMAELRALRPIFAHHHGIEESTSYTERNFFDADQAATVVLPEGLDATAATIIEPLTSVLRSIMTNPPKPGDTCVVLGCGPSAQLAVQVLIRHFGVREVMAVDRVDARLALARQHGAAHTFNVDVDCLAIEQMVRDYQDHYADYVFDALPHVIAREGSGKDARELAMSLLRPGGQYVIYGASGVPQQLSTWLILAKGLHLRAAPFDVRLFPMRRSAHVAQIALGLVEHGVIEVASLVSDVIAFDDESGVRQGFANYGGGDGMKFTLLTERAMSARAHAFAAAADFESPPS